jgi:nitric oxide synthase-interacting protein
MSTNVSFMTFFLRIYLNDLGKARGTKRKFAFDSSTVERLAKEAEESALIQIEKDQAAALKHKLPDFWLPSLTPTYTSNGPPQSLMDVKLQTTCRGGNPLHPLSFVLMPVNPIPRLISHY